MKPLRPPKVPTMPLTLSIKSVPDEIVARLKARAERNHRSLQGELVMIVTAAASEPEPLRLDALEFLARVRAKRSPTPDESAGIVREMRDERAHRRR